MQKIAITLIAILMFTGMASAQDIDVRGGFAFGSNAKIQQDESAVGIFVGGMYELNPEIDLAGTFSFFFIGDEEFNAAGTTSTLNESFWMFDAEAHYNFRLENNITAYPLAGLNFSTAHWEWEGTNLPVVETSATNTEIGINLGGGVEYDLENRWKAFAEAKYIIGNFDQLVVFVGASFTIN